MSDYLPLCAVWQDRQATYTDDGLPVVWDRAVLPVPYIIQLDSGQAPYAHAIRDAARMWNREIGFEVFREAALPEDARVFIVSGSAGDGGLAVTTHSGDVVPESATVELRDIGNFSEAYYCSCHELGHVLGLAEGDSGCMGMMPGDFDASRMWCLPRDKEVMYLRAVYKRT